MAQATTTKTRKATAAIGAHELTKGHRLLGDAICPTRHGGGITVQAVNTDGDYTLILAGGQRLEIPANHTVYIAR